MTLDDDGGSWNELAERAGIEIPKTELGDRFAMDTDLALYWPNVRSDWQEARRADR